MTPMICGVMYCVVLHDMLCELSNCTSQDEQEKQAVTHRCRCVCMKHSHRSLPKTHLRYHVPRAPQPHRAAGADAQALKMPRAVQAAAADLHAADANRGQQRNGGDLFVCGACVRVCCKAVCPKTLRIKPWAHTAQGSLTCTATHVPGAADGPLDARDPRHHLAGRELPGHSPAGVPVCKQSVGNVRL